MVDWSDHTTQELGKCVRKIDAVETSSLALTGYPYKSQLNGEPVASMVAGYGAVITDSMVTTNTEIQKINATVQETSGTIGDTQASMKDAPYCVPPSV